MERNSYETEDGGPAITATVGLRNPETAPDPPGEFPTGLVAEMNELETAQLEAVADYCLRRMLYLEAQEQHDQADSEATSGEIESSPEDWDEDEWDDKLDEVRGKHDVPAKATRTVKQIDGRKYIYAQWREGDKVKSQYIAPVSPKDS